MQIHENNLAINVKVYGGFEVFLSEVYDMLPGTSLANVNRALEFAWELACQEFWEYWTDKERIKKYFEAFEVFDWFINLRIEPGGCSNGWLEVRGFPEYYLNLFAAWPNYLKVVWNTFERAVKADIKYRCSIDSIMDSIKANEWLQPMSTPYNFLNVPGGCISLPTLRGDVVNFVEQKYGNQVAQYIMGVLVGDHSEDLQ